MSQFNEIPAGNLLLQTMAMPMDANPNGDIFGGWIMSQMDIAGSILAREISTGRTATVAVEGMTFIRPVQVGDVVSCYGKLIRVGSTSITLNLDVWVKPKAETINSPPRKVTEAVFSFVSIDDKGNKRQISKPSTATEPAVS